MPLNWDTSPRDDIGIRRIYDIVGQCIYCGATNCKLTDEHTVPNAFGGRHILPKASCERCQKIINEEFEQYCLKSILGVPRTAFDLRSDKRPPGPKAIKVKRAGQIEKIYVDPDDMPVIAHLPMFPPPTALQGKPPSATFDGKLWAHMPRGALEELKAEAVLFDNINPAKFARFLAKIAHCHGVAAMGVGGFVPVLPQIILGKNLLTHHYVGGLLDPAPREDGEVMKMGIALYGRQGDGHQMAVAHMRFFPHLGGPEYIVVLGPLLKSWSELTGR